MKQKPAVYKVPEDVKQGYLQHGGPVLDRWILKNVRCPSCNGAIKTSTCDVGGGTGYTGASVFGRGLNILLLQKPIEYYNRCVVRCGSCNKQFVFTYSYYKFPNSPNSFGLEGELGWDPVRIAAIIAFIIILALALVVLVPLLYQMFVH